MSTLQYFEISAITPKEWHCWFFNILSDNAPFSWGDNNRTLVTAERLHDHCVNILDGIPEEESSTVSQVEIDEFLRNLENLGQTYIDLEN